MKEIEKYIVINENSISDLVRNTNNHIEIGYYPIDGMASFSAGSGKYETQYFTQAMVKCKVEQ